MGRSLNQVFKPLVRFFKECMMHDVVMLSNKFNISKDAVYLAHQKRFSNEIFFFFGLTFIFLASSSPFLAVFLEISALCETFVAFSPVIRNGRKQ